MLRTIQTKGRNSRAGSASVQSIDQVLDIVETFFTELLRPAAEVKKIRPHCKCA